MALQGLWIFKDRFKVKARRNRLPRRGLVDSAFLPMATISFFCRGGIWERFSDLTPKSLSSGRCCELKFLDKHTLQVDCTEYFMIVESWNVEDLKPNHLGPSSTPLIPIPYLPQCLT